MHVRHLIELAGLLSAQAPQLWKLTSSFRPEGLELYRSASAGRNERWLRSLRDYRRLSIHSGGLMTSCQALTRAVLEEIFLSDILVRVWGGVLAGHTQQSDRPDGALVAIESLEAQQIAYREALAILVSGTCLDLPQAADLNRLRRKSERWSDLLLSHLVAQQDLDEFAVDAGRAHDFVSQRSGAAAERHFQQAWPLLRVSLRAAWSELHPGSPSALDNERIAGGVLLSLGPEGFDSLGTFPSAWYTNLLVSGIDRAAPKPSCVPPPRFPRETGSEY